MGRADEMGVVAWRLATHRSSSSASTSSSVPCVRSPPTSASAAATPISASVSVEVVRLRFFALLAAGELSKSTLRFTGGAVCPPAWLWLLTVARIGTALLAWGRRLLLPSPAASAWRCKLGAVDAVDDTCNKGRFGDEGAATTECVAGVLKLPLGHACWTGWWSLPPSRPKPLLLLSLSSSTSGERCCSSGFTTAAAIRAVFKGKINA